MRSRSELLQIALAHKAAYLAAENELKERAAELFETEGSADTWRLPGGMVITSVTQPRAVITDREAFLDWLERNYQHQVKSEVVTVRTVVNQNWLDEQLLGRLVPAAEDEDGGLAVDMEGGAVVPGVRWRKGGTLSGVSIRPDPDLQRRLRAAVAPYIDGAGPMPGLPAGESSPS